MISVIFAGIVTLIIVSPVAGFIAAYKYFYPDRPFIGSNKVYKVGVDPSTFVFEESEPNIIGFEELEINWNIEELRGSV